MQNLNWAYNEKLNIYETSLKYLVWDRELDIKISYLDNLDKEVLLNMDKQIFKIIEKINENKNNILNITTSNGILALAKEWLNSQEKVTENGKNYFKNENNKLIPCNLTKEELITYIVMDTIEIKYSNTKIFADVLLHTEPDCFSKHLIEVFIIKYFSNNKYKMSLNGIVG